MPDGWFRLALFFLRALLSIQHCSLPFPASSMSFRDEMSSVLLSLNTTPFDSRRAGHTGLVILFAFEHNYADAEDYNRMGLTSQWFKFVFRGALGHRQWSLVEGAMHEYGFLMLRNQLEELFPWSTRIRELPLITTPFTAHPGPRTTRLRQLHALRDRLPQ